jgi:hypothetical protein
MELGSGALPFAPARSDDNVRRTTLPPGRFRLLTSPIAIGPAPISKTIGMVVVTDFAASAAGAPPGATITAT